MNPEERAMLEEAVTLSRENNQIVKKMWRATQWGRAVKGLYWFIVIGIAVGSFYFLQPYLDTLKGAYGNLQEVQGQFKNFF